MKVLRLEVPSFCSYALRVLSDESGVVFEDRQIVDIPIRSDEQLDAARRIQEGFVSGNLATKLRNGKNAVCVYAGHVVDVGG